MNQFGSSYHPPTGYNSQQNKPFHGKPNWQPRPQYQRANQQFRPPSYLPNNPPPPPNQSNFRPPRSGDICDFCKMKGHSKDVCFKYQRMLLENAQPPICYMCRQIGHLAYQCPKRSQMGNPNLPGPRSCWLKSTWSNKNTPAQQHSHRHRIQRWCTLECT